VGYRTTPKMAKRKEAHRARLLQIAIRLFGKQGYHATTVPRIVRESGSSTGAFYLYFRNKEHLFACALEAIGERIAGALNTAMAGAGENTISQMRVAVETFILYLAEHPDEARILIVESSGLSAALARIRRPIIASHCRSVEQALTSIADSLPGLDPKVAASCWVGAVHESVYQWLESPKENRISADALAREISGFNLRGIGAPKGSNAKTARHVLAGDNKNGNGGRVGKRRTNPVSLQASETGGGRRERSATSRHG
jgi:TetR/AcrR family fatty acid metabolism transcriptional regulator